MKRNTKFEMRKRARMAMGMLNVLRDDINQVRVDATEYDLVCLEDSLRDVRSTLQMLVDNIAEMEYMVYLTKGK